MIINVPVTEAHLDRAIEAMKDPEKVRVMSRHCIMAQAGRDVWPNLYATAWSEFHVDDDKVYQARNYLVMSAIVTKFDRSLTDADRYKHVRALLPTVIEVEVPEVQG